MKRIFLVLMLLILFTGCSEKVNDMNDSYSKLLKKMCDIYTGKSTYDELISLYPSELSEQLKKEVTKEKYEEGLIEARKTTCSYTNLVIHTEEDYLTTIENIYKKYLSVEFDLEECRSFDLTLGDNTSESSVCKLKSNGKWYLLGK